MECKILIHKEGRNYIETTQLSLDLLEDPSVYWIHFNVVDRKIFDRIETNDIIGPGLVERLKNPGKSFLVERFGVARLLDCNVNYDFKEAHNDYLTFVFLPQVVITCSDVDSLLSKQLNPEEVIDLNRPYNANLVVLTLLRRMLDRNTSLFNQFTKKVDKILKQSMTKSFTAPTEELEQLYSSSIDFSELFEEQLTTIRLLPMNIEEENPQVLGFLDRVEKSMEYLVSLSERAQAKLDYIFQRYANGLQQKANARLNTLTIVQAIFVPLTFLAGIYGMNFVNMPELETQYGYYYLLGLMAIIGTGGLYLFYRNGWFDSK